MTDDTKPVDGNPADDAAPALPLAPPAAVMWSISEIAADRKISKQAVSKSVKKLAADHGLTVDRNGRGHIVKVNVVEFERLQEKLGNASKAQAPKAAPAPSARQAEGGDSYNEALRQKTWHEAERRRIELAELKRELIRLDAVIAALRDAGDLIADLLTRLPNSADDWAAVVARDGAHGLRLAIAAEATRLRGSIAKALASAAGKLADAPAASGGGGEQGAV